MQEKIEAIVRQIVQQYLEDTFEEQKNSKRNRNELLILFEEHPNEISFQTWDAIRKLGEDYSVTICKPQDTEVPKALTAKQIILSKENLDEIREAMGKSSVVILANSPYSNLAKLSLSIDDTFVMWILITMQLDGKKIVILKDSFHLTGTQMVTAPHQLTHRIQHYIRNLQQENVQFLYADQLEPWLNSFFEESKEKRPIVLAKHIEQVAQEGKKMLEIPKNSLMSPMSKDYAKELGVSIKQKE